VSALVVAGCGSGGDDSASAGDSSGGAGANSAPSTKQQWVQQVSDTCAELHAEREAEIQDFQKKAEEEGKKEAASGLTVALEEVVLPSMREQLAALKAIEAPEGEEAKVEAIWAAYARGLAKLEDVVASESGFSGKSPFQQYQAKASAYGLRDCEP
jgi:hypothetical protein